MGAVITGQGLKIISQGPLQVDGEVEGDVGGSEVIIAELGKVTVTIAAERAIWRAQIAGVIRGVMVTLQSTSHVEGDIHHMSLAPTQLLRQLASFEMFPSASTLARRCGSGKLRIDPLTTPAVLG
jgi:hypothetical protein